MRKRGQSGAIGWMILFGVLGGVGFLVYNGFFAASAPAAPVVTPTAANFVSVADAALAAPRTPEAGEIAPTPAPTPATLSIPNAGIRTAIIDVFIVDQTWDVSRLGMNAGHLQGTPRLHEAGNIALVGHVEQSNGTPGVFAGLRRLRVGDLVHVEQGATVRDFRVIEMRTVAPDDLSVLYPSGTNRVTLITCEDYDFLSDSYQERYVVIAEEVNPA